MSNFSDSCEKNDLMLGCKDCIMYDTEVVNSKAIDYCRFAKKPIGKVDEKTKRMPWCPFNKEEHP